MDDVILESVGRALKNIYRCEPVEQLPPHWLSLLQRLEDAIEQSAREPRGLGRGCATESE